MSQLNDPSGLSSNLGSFAEQFLELVQKLEVERTEIKRQALVEKYISDTHIALYEKLEFDFKSLKAENEKLKEELHVIKQGQGVSKVQTRVEGRKHNHDSCRRKFKRFRDRTVRIEKRNHILEEKEKKHIKRITRLKLNHERLNEENMRLWRNLRAVSVGPSKPLRGLGSQNRPITLV